MSKALDALYVWIRLTMVSEMINLKARVEIYESLLKQLKSQVDSAGQFAISKALEGVSICTALTWSLYSHLAAIAFIRYHPAIP